MRLKSNSVQSRAIIPSIRQWHVRVSVFVYFSLSSANYYYIHTQFRDITLPDYIPMYNRIYSVYVVKYKGKGPGLRRYDPCNVPLLYKESQSKNSRISRLVEPCW